MKNLIQKAILFAMNAHMGETRKVDGKKPYVLHVLEAGIVASNYTTSEDLIAAAILHDVIEHKKITPESIKDEFGEDVVFFVKMLTEDDSITDWPERKNENLERLSRNDAAYFLKAVDAYVNMKDLFSEIVSHGESVWEKFNAPKDLKMQYFRRILNDTKSHLPSDLMEKYVGTLKDLEYAHLLSENCPEIGFKESQGKNN